MVKKIHRIAWAETKYFFLNSKMIILLFELIFFCETYLSHVKELSEISGLSLSYFEPYLLVATGDLFFVAIPLVYMVLLLGFPSKNSMNYFSLIRISRFEWMMGEVIFLIWSAVGYLAVINLGIFLYMRKSILVKNSWSEYMLVFRKFLPDLFEESQNYFLKAGMMTHGDLCSVYIHSIMLMLCMLICIALILMFFTLLKKKYVGILLTVVISIGSAFASYDNGMTKWIFPMTHTNYGAHYQGIRAQENMTLGMSYIYFGVLFFILLTVNWAISKKVHMEA